MRTNKIITRTSKKVRKGEFFINPRRAVIIGKIYKPRASHPTPEEKTRSGLPQATTYANEASTNNTTPIIKYFFVKFIRIKKFSSPKIKMWFEPTRPPVTIAPGDCGQVFFSGFPACRQVLRF